jgi:hypothetical protein
MPAEEEAMKYSHNTRAVWHARRTNRILYSSALIALGVLLLILVVYWLSIGAPTNPEDIPFIDTLVGSA